MVSIIEKFFDTSAILELGEKVSKESFFYISSITIQELENIKNSKYKDENVKYKARKVIEFLNKNKNGYTVVPFNTSLNELIKERDLEFTPDNKILACAKRFIDNMIFLGKDIVFVTNDASMRIIGSFLFGLDVITLVPESKEIYKGYKKISGDSKTINNLMCNIDFKDWKVNEYLIIENTEENKETEMRFDGTHFVNLKLPSSKYIKAKNSLQRCALDILMNPNISIAAILGGYGSGKTYLSMKMALYNVIEKGYQSRILGIREPKGEGLECGYLPGTLDDKTENFFLPLVQQLDNGEFEFERLKQQGILTSNIPYYMKGTTYNDTIIFVDEAEDLNEKQIKLIGTRLGNNSKIYLSGDYNQSSIDASMNNPLIKMCNEFKGNPMFACIYLGEDVRSNASKLFANLFNN